MASPPALRRAMSVGEESVASSEVGGEGGGTVDSPTTAQIKQRLRTAQERFESIKSRAGQ